jgi:enoyl-CoA hydratase/carnithine racemase
MPMGDLVTVEVGEVVVLRIDNPPLNLITTRVTAALGEAISRIEHDKSIRAAVVAAAGGRAFSAGSDIGEFGELAGRVAEGKLAFENEVFSRLAALAIPTVAAIEGDAIGGGLELALCCDLRVASSAARLGLPEVRLGVIPGSGGIQRLPRVVGPARAAEMVLLGELYIAEVAERFGLVNRVVGPGEAEAAAVELATELAKRGPLAVREAKRELARSLDMTVEEGVRASLVASERVFASEDMTEGVAAFKEKRTPRFRNR